MTLKEIFLGDVRHLFRRRGAAIAHSAGRRTELHWRMLFTAFALAVIAVTAASFFLFERINRGDFIPSTPARAQRAQTEGELLQETLRYFEEKRTAFDAVKKDGNVPVDPSR